MESAVPDTPVPGVPLSLARDRILPSYLPLGGLIFFACTLPNHPVLHMKYLSPQQFRQPVVLTAGDKHLSPRDAV